LNGQRAHKIVGALPGVERPVQAARTKFVILNRHRGHLRPQKHRPTRHRGHGQKEELSVIDVFSTTSMAKLATIETEAGAHTTALSPAGDWLCAFLPRTHRAAVYEVASP
jgi:hypothetical protein